MAVAKKLQVFVSSTFTDLHSERQAAVEAILSAGHIPAGMELFAAGDESQMVVIRRWIDESDVFMLILGNRYGSIERQSLKSYIQLEYEYALAQRKPLFAVVRRADSTPSNVAEHSEQLSTFRALVQEKIVRWWNEPNDIKLAIHETLAEFGRRSELHGWVRAEDNVNMGAISQEIARLSNENALLRERLAVTAPRLFNGLTFDELFRMLASSKWIVSQQNASKEFGALLETAKFFKHDRPAPLHLLWHLSWKLVRGTHITTHVLLTFAHQLEEAGLIVLPHPANTDTLYRLTDVGTQFLLCLRNAYDTGPIEDFRAS